MADGKTAAEYGGWAGALNAGILEAKQRGELIGLAALPFTIGGLGLMIMGSGMLAMGNTILGVVIGAVGIVLSLYPTKIHPKAGRHIPK